MDLTVIFKFQNSIFLKGGYHDDTAENGYVVTARHSHEIRDVTNGDVTKRSESAKHPS